jgi:hypothetical protein
MGCGRGHE